MNNFFFFLSVLEVEPGPVHARQRSTINVHLQPLLLFYFETGFNEFDQAGLELVTVQLQLPLAGFTYMPHHAWFNMNN